MGLAIFAGTGFQVHTNSFEGENQEGTTGALLWNTGIDDNLVELNNYSSLRQANLANFINRYTDPSRPEKGLNYPCNTYGQSVFDMAALGSDSLVDGIAPAQGTLNLPSGNTFNGGYWYMPYNIWNQPGKVGAITYYYNPTGTNQEPTSIYGNVQKYAGNSNNTCDIKPDTLGANGPVSDPYGPGFQATSSTVRHYLADSSGFRNADSIIHYLKDMNSPYADAILAQYYIGQGEYTLANEWYNGIVTRHDLTGRYAEEFSTFGRSLLNLQTEMMTNGKDFTDLSTAQVDTLEYIEAQATSWAKVQAQNWLRDYDGREIYNTILIPEPEEGDGGSFKKLQIPETKANMIYPNPAKDELWVKIQKSDSYLISIFDQNGRLVFSKRIESANEIEKVDISNLTTGI